MTIPAILPIKNGTDYFSPRPALCPTCGEYSHWFRNENGRTAGCIACATPPGGHDGFHDRLR